MGPDVRTESSTGETEGPVDSASDWLFLNGDRRIVAAGIVVAFAGIVGLFVFLGLVAVGVDSSVSQVFGSGLTAGVVTLVTIALSINQLILSRVFGSPNTLRDRLDGSRVLRERVAELAGEPVSPNDPATFLSLLAVTLSERATSAASILEQDESETPTELTEALRNIAEYGRSIDDHAEAETPVSDVLSVIVGTEYAINMAAVEHLQNAYAGSIPAEAEVELRVLEDLLESIAVVRQFFKTLVLQQDFAVLSRQLVYSGLIALLGSVSLTLVYRTDTVTIDPSVLPILVPVVLGVVVTPLGVFAAYILRAATIAHRTISVGPFVPPEERS